MPINKERGWREMFEEKFKATGAHVEGFKRMEYPNLREHQYHEVMDFIASVERDVYKRCGEIAIGMKSKRASGKSNGFRGMRARNRNKAFDDLAAQFTALSKE